ncbi:DNA excision repair protein ERCC-6-like isoform X2 [Hemitrygon akajei]|uniref:DNA excision repair protein ERCC-6-like isoform X2 n=1 Tax=Hemitrygon akajei TaxID=2704970 RepID=UPI003BF9B10F
MVVAAEGGVPAFDCSVAPTGSTLSSEQLERYRKCVARAKEQARSGNLQAALDLLSEAMTLRPSERLERRIRKVQEALEAQDDEGEDEDEWVPVEGCELRLYRQLYERLHPHQRRGVAFLHRLYAEQRGGGILADDMGLGKTIQLLAFLSGMFDARLLHSVLVLMPASLIANWMDEFVSWTPGLRVKAFHGSKAERTRNLEKVQRKGGVVITTYQLVIYNLEQLSHLDGQPFTWDYMVLDEAHKIKSQLSKTTKHVNAILAKNRVLLTGTPLQNNLQEMWTLFDFACQGSLLGPLKTFKTMYENPITRAREKDASPAEKELGLRISETLMSLIEPYFLRRTKEGIRDLEERHLEAETGGWRPAAKGNMLSLSRKNDLIVWVHLSPIQEEIYRKFVSSELIQELLQTKLSPLVQLNNLKKLCDHPRLLSRRVWGELGLDGGDGDSYDVRRVSRELLVQESGKLVFLLGLLERLREEGHRTLVFSQSRKMLDIVQRVLTARGFQLARIDGTMALPERQKVVESFQRYSHCSVFLLTTQVGGVGLTLTAANRVVIIDPSWNPATDAQAVDRAYRIGQTEDVLIYRLVTCGSVEEKIYRRQIFKDSLIRQSMGESKNPFRYFSRQELRELFVLEDPRYSNTQRQLQTLHAGQWGTDAVLEQHITFLHSLPVFGVTRHNLVHLQDVAPDEENPVNDPASQRYIEERVQLAQDLVAAGSQLQREVGVPPSPPASRGKGGGIGRLVLEPDSGETPFIDLTQLPSDTETKDTEERLIPEPDSGATPPPKDLTQLPSDRELEGGEGRKGPELDFREMPPPIDLVHLPTDGETEDPVSDLSCRLARLPVDSGEDNSIVFVPNVPSPCGTGTEEQGGAVSVFWDPSLGERGKVIPDPTDSQCEAFPELNISQSLLHSGFQLVLEDTVEKSSGAACQPEACSVLEASWAAEPVGAQSPSLNGGLDNPNEESPPIVFSRGKGRVRVIDSDDEEPADDSPGLCVVGRPLETFDLPAASTPKGLNLPPLALHDTSVCSLSRRSLVRSVLDEMEDSSEEEEEGEDSAEQSGGERDQELVGSGSDLGEQEPQASTTGSEEEESETFNPELGSNEQMEPFAQAVVGQPSPDLGRERSCGHGSLADLESVIQELTGLTARSPGDDRGSLPLTLDECDSLLRQFAEPSPGEGTGSVRPSLESLMLELTRLCTETSREGMSLAELPLGECRSLEKGPIDPGPVDKEVRDRPEPTVEKWKSLPEHTELGTGAVCEDDRPEPTDPGTGIPSEDSRLEPAKGQWESLGRNPSDPGTGSPSIGHISDPTLEEYERLVRCGKEQIECGEFKAALDYFLQALDLKSGDPEVQLTTIKLYRQLATS